MGKVDGHELVLTRGEGSRLWDADGNEYLDATAGLWFANVGHGRAEIADAVADQLRTSPRTTSSATTRTARPRTRIPVADIAPLDDAAVFFGSSGGEAIDTAAKIARRYWALLGQPSGRSSSHDASRITARTLRHLAVRDPGVRDGYGRSSATSPRWSTTTRPTSPASSTSSATASAAFVGEPVIGAGGVIPPPDGYWPAVGRHLPRARRAARRRRGDLGVRTARDAGSAASGTASPPIS